MKKVDSKFSIELNLTQFTDEEGEVYDLDIKKNNFYCSILC